MRSYFDEDKIKNSIKKHDKIVLFVGYLINKISTFLAHPSWC